MGFVVSDIGRTNAMFAHCASRTGMLEHLSFERCVDFRTIEAEKFNFVWVCEEVQILPRTQHFQQLQAPPSLRMAVFLIELDPNGLAKSHLID